MLKRKKNLTFTVRFCALVLACGKAQNIKVRYRSSKINKTKNGRFFNTINALHFNLINSLRKGKRVRYGCGDKFENTTVCSKINRIMR